jgi:hypothetical protein
MPKARQSICACTHPRVPDLTAGRRPTDKPCREAAKAALREK